MQSRLKIAVGAWCGSLMLLAGVQTGALAEQVIFTIAPASSTYSITGGDTVHGVFGEQGAGSAQTHAAGHFLVDFDPLSGAPSSMTFVGGHGFIDLGVSGSWLPGPGGVGSAAPADIGLQTPGGDVKLAVRDLAWDWTSSAIPVNLDGSFDEAQLGFVILGGSFDYIHPDIAPGFGTGNYSGTGTLEEFGAASLVETSAGQWTLSIPGKVTTTYNTDTQFHQGTITYSAQLVATAQFGANNVDAVAPAQTQAQALGGSSVVGGVSANLSTANSGGTFSVQQVPNQTGLPQAAVIAAQANPIFALSTAALSTDPQIWNVDFSGDLGGTIELVFAYDESLLPAGTDESTLGIWHFNSNTGQWDFGGTVDSVANTVTFTTDNLSPFELGVAVVPEPCTLALAAIGLIALAAFGWRRRKR